MDSNGRLLLNLAGAVHDYGTEYGLTECESHDAMKPPYCVVTNGTGHFDPLGNPAWCSQTWCYIDRYNCNVDYTQTQWACLNGVCADLHYSYPACANDNIFNEYWNTIQPTNPPPSPSRPPYPPPPPPSPPPPPPPPPPQPPDFTAFPPPAPPEVREDDSVQVSDDPHLAFHHGGRADFRGENNTWCAARRPPPPSPSRAPALSRSVPLSARVCVLCPSL
jgi:hypothetical protein